MGLGGRLFPEVRLLLYPLFTVPQKRVSYDDAITRGARSAFRAFVPLARPEKVAPLLQLLEPAPRSLRRQLFARYPQLSHPKVVRDLVASSFALRRSDLQRGLRLARLAVACSLSALRRFPSPAIAWDLCAEALANLANYHRILGDFAAAELAFRRADRALGHGSGDASLEARLASLQSSLRRAQRRLPEAVRCLRQAIAIEADLGDREAEARLHSKLAWTHSVGGDDDSAYREALRALAGLDPANDEEVYFEAVHNALGLLHEIGLSRPALEMLRDFELTYGVLGGPLMELRGWWLKGRLHCDHEEWKEAEAYLQRASVGFRNYGLLFESAIAGLDLALVYAEQRNFFALARLAREMHAVFVSKDIPGEASAALLLFARSAQQMTATADSISALLERLRALHREALDL